MSTQDNTIKTEFPYGYCQCGCGQKTSICKKGRVKTGDIKGKPFKFIKHHGVNKRIKQSFLERFWSMVDKKDNPDDCWGWTGGKIKFGYGHFWFNNKTIKAHRMSWLIHFGEIPNGLLVLHKCDNPSCVNPSHLFLGTYQDNEDDKEAKHRRPKAEQKSNTSLSNQDVLTIRKRYKSGGITQKTLADEYGVSDTAIWNIINNIAWKSLK